jgi:hypothetical protein
MYFIHVVVGLVGSVRLVWFGLVCFVLVFLVCLFGWLVGWLAGWLAGWLVGR